MTEVTNDSQEKRDPMRPRANRRGPGVLGVLASVAFVVLLVILLLPSMQATRTPSNRLVCANMLKQIAVALQTYHDAHGTFPPAFVADDEGKPVHSWRVLLLPYFEGTDMHALYRRYRLDEPWNSAQNRELADEMPYFCHCMSDDAECETSYVAVVGERTSWPGAVGRPISQITDGTSRTICIAEVKNSCINWMEPRDLTFEEACRGINRPPLSISSAHRDGANVLFCDGSVHYLTDTTSADALRALLTSDGGEQLDFDDDGDWILASPARAEDPQKTAESRLSH